MTEAVDKLTLNAAKLNADDVQKLSESSVEKRLDLTRKLVDAYHYEGTPDAYRQVADDVFRALAKDSSDDVRLYFADAIKTSVIAPPDVVKRLAHDIDDVAAPILEYSSVLTDKDVADVVAKSVKSEKKLCAVAGRPKVAKPTSLMLANSGFCTVATRLVGNPGADVGERALNVIIEKYHEEDKTMAALLSRKQLPASAMDMAAARISQNMLKIISEQYPGLRNVANEVAKKSLGALAARDSAGAVKEYPIFVKKMKETHAAEEVIGIIALALAKPSLFEMYLSQKLDVPVVNVRALLADETDRGFYALYHRAKMPLHLYDATLLLRDAVAYLDVPPRPGDLALSLAVANRLIEVMQLLAEESEHEIEHMEYIVALIRYSQRLF